MTNTESATTQLNSKLEMAYQEYIQRQRRESHPAGKFDRGGRWYPSDEERQSCCSVIRSPSRSWPWSLMTHCRTVEHVARLFGIEPAVLKALVNNRKERKPAVREGGDDYFKAVRIDADGRMSSLYNKSPLTYEIAVTVHDAPHQEHNGGVYVYRNAQAARELAQYDYHLSAGDYVVLRCRCGGAYCIYPSDIQDGIVDRTKLAFSNVTPLEIVN